jgi:hypothetical protein
VTLGLLFQNPGVIRNVVLEFGNVADETIDELELGHAETGGVTEGVRQDMRGRIAKVTRVVKP